MATAADTRADRLLAQVKAEAAAVLPAHAEVERLRYQVGALSTHIETLCEEATAFQAPPAKGKDRSAEVEVNGITLTAHYAIEPAHSGSWGWRAAYPEIGAVYVAGQDVLGMLDGDTRNAIAQAIEAGEVVS